jgi:hypothetical protein
MSFVLMAVQPGPILATVLREQGMSQKEASLVMGYANPAELSRALLGERGLDTRRVVLLRWSVFAAFWSRLVAAKADEDAQEMRAERLQMARADLRPVTERKAV